MRINFDMDGVLAKFLFGTPFSNLYKEHYWTNLPPQENPLNAAKVLTSSYDVGIVSAYLKDSPYALNEKKGWLRKQIPEIPEESWSFLPCGESKGTFLINPGDILIDDRWVHGKEWTDAGGKFIKVSVNKEDAAKESKRYPFVIYPEMKVAEILDVVERTKNGTEKTSC